MTDLELQIGAQTRAANVLAQRMPEVQQVMNDLVRSLESELASFQGQGAGALAQALQEWFRVAAELPEMLNAYGAALVAVDNNVSDSEAGSAAHYGSFTRRLGAF